MPVPICSYLVIPEEGAADRVGRRLAGLPGCEVTPARDRDLLILVTDTPGLEEEEELRSRIEAMKGIRALLFTFGEIDPETSVPDPVTVGNAPGRRRGPAAPTGRGGGDEEEAEGEARRRASPGKR